MPSAFTLEPASWGEFPAHRLRNAHLEVVVVPALGRIMHFAHAGESPADNQLWTDTLRREGDTYVSVLGWAAWGGDKTWLAPQARWPEFAGPARMGDPAWGEPPHGEHSASVLPDGTLRVTGPASRYSGLRLARDYRLDADELVIRQTVENTSAADTWRVALWSVTNVPRPESVYLLPATASAYPGGVRPMVRDTKEFVFATDGPLLVYRPDSVRAIKFGLDADHAALASLRGDKLFLQRAEHPPGEYPDGPRHQPDLPGMCVEYFDTGDEWPRRYAELELLGPLVDLSPGAHTALTVRWSLHRLAAGEAPDAEWLAALLRRPVRPGLADDGGAA